MPEGAAISSRPKNSWGALAIALSALTAGAVFFVLDSRVLRPMGGRSVYKVVFSPGADSVYVQYRERDIRLSDRITSPKLWHLPTVLAKYELPKQGPPMKVLEDVFLSQLIADPKSRGMLGCTSLIVYSIRNGTVTKNFEKAGHVIEALGPGKVLLREIGGVRVPKPIYISNLDNCTSVILSEQPLGLLDAKFSRSGHLLSLFDRHDLKVFSSTTGDFVARVTNDRDICECIIAGARDVIAWSSDTGMVRLYDLRDNIVLQTWSLPAKYPLISITDDAEHVLASQDDECIVLNTRIGGIVARKRFSSYVTSVGIPSADTVPIGCDNGDVWIWDFVNNRVLFERN